ncbi:hypothetical protein H6F96_02145 [Microcoleus sp. FACHB-53]|nr:hypothetical protein [Microcoleus sp. FACHB-53]
MLLLTKDCAESQKALSKVVAQAWLDEGFKERFISEPVAVLRENGLTLPNGVTVRVNESSSEGSLMSADINVDSNQVYEISLPSKPTELTDSEVQSWSDIDNPEEPPIVICA